MVSKNRLPISFGAFLLVCLFSAVAAGQEVYLSFNFRMEPVVVTRAPVLNGSPQIDYPAEARKNGVEGKLTAYFTIDSDGSVKDIAIVKSLGYGVDEAVANGLRPLRFVPATLEKSAVPVRMYFDYVVSVVYGEWDKSVTKPKITSQPDPAYPPEHLSERIKGDVFVSVLFNADGSLNVLNVNSVMPKEFDKAAMEAAAKIKFTPAVHKKSKKPVSQRITVVYKFKG